MLYDRVGVRVLHIQKVKGIGGSERHLLTLLPALAEWGVDVRMCVLAEGDADAFLTELAGVDVHASVVPAGRDVNPMLVPSLYREVRSFRPHVVHTHLVHADVYGLAAARLAGTPAVSSVHGTPAFYAERRYQMLGRLTGRWAARRIAISRSVADFIERHELGEPERIRHIYYGISTEGWRFTSEERALLRTREGFAEDDVVVGIAARLIPGKGHPQLIDAFDTAAATHPRLRLLIAGDGPDRAELERRAAHASHADRIRFLGYVPNVRGFMNVCDVTVFPTTPALGEGFGLAALEAMAAGRPVVATAVGSLPEVVVDGETGIVVPPGRPAALAEALTALADDAELRARMGALGALRAESMFSTEVMVDATIAVYDELL